MTLWMPAGPFSDSIVLNILGNQDTADMVNTPMKMKFTDGASVVSSFKNMVK